MRKFLRPTPTLSHTTMQSRGLRGEGGMHPTGATNVSVCEYERHSGVTFCELQLKCLEVKAETNMSEC